MLNSLSTTLNKSLRTSPETNFRLILAFTWSKNNFGEIHIVSKRLRLDWEIPTHSIPLGTLSEDDDDGSENDGKKMNLRSFKLNRVCLDLLNMSNAGDFSWS